MSSKKLLAISVHNDTGIGSREEKKTRRGVTYLQLERVCLSTQNFRPSLERRITIGAFSSYKGWNTGSSRVLLCSERPVSSLASTFPFLLVPGELEASGSEEPYVSGMYSTGDELRDCRGDSPWSDVSST